ncbi:MAG: hypothetical protein JXA90_16785, partial [Planctomycetes bacterium]|nr:hypothetical protein [Planctomycetota bacterium]
MESLKGLKERRDALAKDIRALADKANDPQAKWGESEEQRWKELNAAFDEVHGKVERLERASGVVSTLEKSDEAYQAKFAGIRPTLERLEDDDEPGGAK